MVVNPITPRKALNKAFLKVKPNRNDIELFKKNLIRLIDQINEAESEEFHKNLVSVFLRDTYYHDQHFINTKSRNDLVIHNGKDAKTTVGVIIEAKKPANKSEMISRENLNQKALQELLLYYLRERITNNNLELKYLVATNIYEWFVFDSHLFEKQFAQNKNLVAQFTDFEEGRMAGKTTDFFYKEIAAPAIASIETDFTFTYFNIRDFNKPLRNSDKDDDKVLIPVYKIFAPQHLLKLPFANDSNSLDKTFYTELLHIIGLSEVKDGNKKLIQRRKEGNRYQASLMENAIVQLDSLDKISRLPKPDQFGQNHQERLFNVALELSITWINRILFLKLLEAQLVRYHRGNKQFTFLNIEKVKDFDGLNLLFFSVLARMPEDRTEAVKKLFAEVPYLNSSLFEPTELEHSCLFISQLHEGKIPILAGTVLKDTVGKKRSGELETLEYLFEFLNAYDFSSEGAEDVQEENKTLINASVLGLIFEKINGYKDGSFFTPGFITMYMCRETIRRAVVQKFNEAKGWNCENIDSLFDKIQDKKEANQIINSLKICDPAVGSGHFLVSALNEIIAIKSELKILLDRQGKTLRDYHVEVINDELIVTDDDARPFEYHPGNPESQRVQEALFHEKQTIIENCLFGVDINPNSVKICRLRLWIELLKNAYYRTDRKSWSRPAPTEIDKSRLVLTSRPVPTLETLPNIDINIKCGNSLINRYALDADIKTALKRSKWSIDSYRIAVMTYRNAQSKEEKRAMEKLISQIKNDFESEIATNDKRLLKLNKLKGELIALTAQTSMFELSAKEKVAWNKQVSTLTLEIQAIEKEIDEIKTNKIYENAFEWRFEFPEVLNDDGDFVGFDVVIGNPPYIRQEEIKDQKPYLKSNYNIYTGTSDIYVFFIERGFSILKGIGNFCFIMPNKWMQAEYGRPLRIMLLQQQLQQVLDFGDLQVFDEATTYPCIVNVSKTDPMKTIKTLTVKSLNLEIGFDQYVISNRQEVDISVLGAETWVITSDKERNIISKVKSISVSLFDYVDGKSYRGILTGLTEAFVIDENTKDKLVAEDINSDKLIRPLLLGRNVRPYYEPIINNYLIIIPKGFTIRRNLDPIDPNYLKEPVPRYSNMEYDDAWVWFRSNFPAISSYLLPHKEKAEARIDKGDFWWELRACDYYDKFEHPKILYQVFQVKPCFIYDDKGMYCNNSMWIIPSDDKVLLGIINSKMGWWLISKYCTAIQNGYQLIWKYFGQIPIPNESKKNTNIEAKVEQTINIKKSDPAANTTALEAEIDRLVYELYGLTDEEIRIVEGGSKLI